MEGQLIYLTQTHAHINDVDGPTVPTRHKYKYCDSCNKRKRLEAMPTYITVDVLTKLGDISLIYRKRATDLIFQDGCILGREG